MMHEYENSGSGSYTYCGLKFHTDSIAPSDGISMANCFVTEKLNLNEYR